LIRVRGMGTSVLIGRQAPIDTPSGEEKAAEQHKRQNNFYDPDCRTIVSHFSHPYFFKRLT
jgi:hypothetical protein